MKKLTILFSMACMFFAMQAYAQCESAITPSQAAAKAANGDQGSYCIEGYVVSTVDIYCKTSTYENQSFMMADAPGGTPVFEAWRVVGADHTIGIGSFVRIVDATLQMYGNVAETKAGFTVQIISEVPTVVNLPEYGTHLDAEEARDLCLTFPYHNQPTEDMFVVEGYAISVATYESDQSMLTVSLSTTSTGEEMFRAWECKIQSSMIKEGDYVYVTGHLSRYNKNAQIKDGYVTAENPMEPYSVRVTADPDKGYALISGTTDFLFAENTESCTLTANPEPGYEFVMWIDPRFVGSSESDLEIAQTILTWYETVTHFTEDELQEYLENEEMDRYSFDLRVAIIEKLLQPETTLNAFDMASWIYLNDLIDEHILYFSPVFRLSEGIDHVNHKSEIINHKLIKDGQLLILRNGKIINVLGQPVR